MEMENIPERPISPALTEIIDTDIIENVQAVAVEPDPAGIIVAMFNQKNTQISKLERRVNQLEALLRENGIVENVNEPHRDTEEEEETRPPMVLVDLESEPVSPPENEAEVLPQVPIMPIRPTGLPVLRIRRQSQDPRVFEHVLPNPTVETRPPARRRSMRVAESARQHETTTTTTVSPHSPRITVADPRRRGRSSNSSGALVRG
ncbi:unnamed protein product [Orchesella dallaii]|uniref:Uncharacterized protein n=1 Tax=Orchesella dallaii TaxID=48710 RepID=A0ABP1RMS3_9HEXA